MILTTTDIIFFWLVVLLCLASKYSCQESDVRLVLRGNPIQNNSVVTIDEIGENEDALTCTTTLRPCCSSPPARYGEWYYPNGTLVPTSDAGHDFYRNRGDDGTVRLNRRNNAESPSAVFYCQLPDSSGNMQSLYVGLYVDLFLVGTSYVSALTYNSATRTITCVSDRGPARTVTWRKNCMIIRPDSIDYQFSQRVVSTQIPTYESTLTFASNLSNIDGEYSCSVRNERGYTRQRIGIGGDYTPLRIHGSISGAGYYSLGAPITLLCTISPSTPINGHVVSYQIFGPDGNPVGSESAFSVDRLRESYGGEYACLITLTNSTHQLFGCALEQIVPSGDVNLQVTVHGTTATAGNPFTLSCWVAGVNLNDDGVTTMYTWLRGSSVVQETSTSNEYDITSVQVSNAGEVYTCEVVVSISYYDVTGPFSANGTGSPLSVTIPQPDITASNIQTYVGLNSSLVCDIILRNTLSGIEATVNWTAPSGAILPESSSNDRITVNELFVLSPGSHHQSTVIFSSASSSDTGVYRCSVVLRPMVDNQYVSNAIRIRDVRLQVHTPHLAVELAANIPSRVLDLSSYNGFSLTCTATTRGFEDGTALTKAFNWTQSINGGQTEYLLASNDEISITSVHLQEETATSLLTVNATQSGSHVYTCTAVLIVAPAPDIIQSQRQQTVTVHGPASPIAVSGILVTDVTHGSASVQWTVSSLNYGPESYVVKYGTSEDHLNETSSTVTSGNDTVNFLRNGRIELSELGVATTYYLQVVASNSAGSTQGETASFVTAGLAPEPPMSLQASMVGPVTFEFTWTPPNVTNGELAGYQLTCQPQENGVVAPQAMEIDSGNTLSVTLTNLQNSVMYSCTIKAKNAAGYSLPSAAIEITTSEEIIEVTTREETASVRSNTDNTETIIMASVFGGTILVIILVIIVMLGVQCHQAKQLSAYRRRFQVEAPVGTIPNVAYHVVPEQVNDEVGGERRTNPQIVIRERPGPPPRPRANVVPNMHAQTYYEPVPH